MEHDDGCLIEGGYVVMPRHIASDNRNGYISNPERNLLMWIRLIADMKGVAHCSMHGLADEAFNGKVSNSHINRILRSLKSKRYLWYRDRNGCRGTFEVHLPDWFIRNGEVKDIENLFEKELSRTQTKDEHEPKPQPKPNVDDMKQRIEERKRDISKMFSRSSDNA